MKFQICPNMATIYRLTTNLSPIIGLRGTASRSNIAVFLKDISFLLVLHPVREASMFSILRLLLGGL